MKIIMIRNNKLNLKYSYNLNYEYFNCIFNSHINSAKLITFLLPASCFSSLANKFFSDIKA